MMQGFRRVLKVAFAVWQEPRWEDPVYVLDHLAMLRAMHRAGPQVTDEKCLDCGGLSQQCSPPWYEHTEDCRGMARSKGVYALFQEHKR